MAKNQNFVEKVTTFSEMFGFLGDFLLLFMSYFRSKLRQKIISLVIILCFIFFLCLRIDFVELKYWIWKNNPGPQADTASY